MSSITIKFDLGNAVFEGEDLGPSISTTLDNLAERFREQKRGFFAQPGQSFVVYDDNGNSIGKATLHEVEEDWEEADDYISGMSRDYVVELLVEQGFKCYDEESTALLRVQLLQCVKDGDLTLEQVGSHCGD